MASEAHFIQRQSPHFVAFSLGHRTFPWAPTGRTSGIPPRVKLRGLGGEQTRMPTSRAGAWEGRRPGGPALGGAELPPNQVGGNQIGL